MPWRHRRDMARALVVLLSAAALLSVAALAPWQGGGTTTVILVRHAEKARTPADDPPLDSLGERRARALAETLRDTRIEAILVTQYRRTALTAGPLARAVGLTPRAVDTRSGGEAHAKAVADAARAEAGKTVLVVGHSNTIPMIVRALGGSAQPMADEDYDDLYVVIVPASGSGAVRTIRARYGASAHSERSAESR